MKQGCNVLFFRGNPYSDIQYGYDLVGNVIQVASSYSWLQNRSFMESFTYDVSDQLTAATEMHNQSYSLSVTYGNWGKITSYSLAQTDLQNNTTQSETQAYTYPATNSIGSSQTLFAPASRTIHGIQHHNSNQSLTFGINGSLRKTEVQFPVSNQNTEYYLFNSASNLKAYSNNGLDFAYYGYNAANTRTYKLSFLNQNQWVNGQPEPLDLQLQSAMFYPNAYINFNQNGEYTKHYYNGTERIASRLGSSTQPTDATSNDRLEYRMMREEEKFRENIQELVSDGQPVDFQGTVELNSLQPANATSDIFYYHTNHLGSTAYVTDNNATITQGFLYAPFGEITTEYNATFGNDIIPKYSFNAKELDEEIGMYYHEARYYKPPVFTSRDPLMDQKPWLNPYHYCSNNPVGKTDPSGKKDRPFNGKKDKRITIQEGTETYVTYELNDKGKPVFSKKSQKDSYNCHSYAWHKSQGDPNPATSDIPKINGSYLPRWDENPADDIKEQKARQLGKNENNLPGDIVIYYTDYNGNGQYDDDEPISHSAVVKEVDEEGFTIVVIGKMGQGPISINHPDAPDYYKIDENGKETSRAYFRRPATTDTTNN